MATLRVQFCGMFLWVADGKRVTALLPETRGHHGGGGHMEPHFARILVPQRAGAREKDDFQIVPLDDGILALPKIGQDNVTTHNLESRELAPLRDAVNRGAERVLLSGPLDGRTRARVALHEGSSTGHVATCEFDYNGGSAPIAHVVTWEVKNVGSSVTLEVRNRANNAVAHSATVQAGLVEQGFIDLQIHYEPDEHYPWNGRTFDCEQGRYSEHYPAFFPLVGNPTNAQIPRCRGPRRDGLKTTAAVGRLGGDPVTCVQGTGYPPED